MNYLKQAQQHIDETTNKRLTKSLSANELQKALLSLLDFLEDSNMLKIIFNIRKVVKMIINIISILRPLLFRL